MIPEGDVRNRSLERRRDRRKIEARRTYRTGRGTVGLFPRRRGPHPHKPYLKRASAAGSFRPPGGDQIRIVVKENYMPDKKLAAITVMYKVAGYNPGVGDWFWAKYTPDGKVEAEGKSGMADMCIGCHGKAKGNDFLFTGDLK
jgi:hypothetical protein